MKGSLVWILNLYDTKEKKLYDDVRLRYDDNKNLCTFIDQAERGNAFIYDESAIFCIKKNNNNTFDLIGKIPDPESDYTGFKLVDKTKNIYLSDYIGKSTYKAYLRPYGCTLPTQT